MYAKKIYIYPASVSKHNSNRAKKVIILMISNWEKRKAKSDRHEAKYKGQEQWNYLAVKKKKSALLKRIYSFRTKKLESHKEVCENKDFCYVIIPSEDTKILEFNHYQKSDKALFIIYLDYAKIFLKTHLQQN